MEIEKDLPCRQIMVIQRGGRDSNTIPFRGPAGEKKKTRFIIRSSAGRAGFEPAAEFHPSTHLAGEPNRPLWHLPNRPSGGSGIRTHDGFHHTCFQDRRLKPLGHPSRFGFYRCARILSYIPHPDKIPCAWVSDRRGCGFKLAVIQLSVKTILCQQSLMAALFHDIAILHYQNQVCITDGGKTVRNHKAGTVLH